MGKVTDVDWGTTVRTICQLAADRTDMLKDDGAGGVDLADNTGGYGFLAQYVSYELATLWDVLINTYEDYLVYRRFIDVEADKEDYALPEDFYKFRKVFPIVSGKRCRPLRKFNLEKLGDADSLAAIYTSEIEDARYKIIGSRLWIHPIPTSAAQLELWYVPQFHIMRNYDDLVPHQFPNGWEEYVIEGVAARLMEKEESDATPYRARQREILQRILVLAEDRDVGEPHQMQDSEGYNNSHDGWWG
jgi:hypothetical protein